MSKVTAFVGGAATRQTGSAVHVKGF